MPRRAHQHSAWACRLAAAGPEHCGPEELHNLNRRAACGHRLCGRERAQRRVMCCARAPRKRTGLWLLAGVGLRVGGVCVRAHSSSGVTLRVADDAGHVEETHLKCPPRLHPSSAPAGHHVRQRREHHSPPASWNRGQAREEATGLPGRGLWQQSFEGLMLVGKKRGREG
eukprot:44242-Rhodomonas_salina.1